MTARQSSGSRRRKALLFTYTMNNPSAVGVFFRALRLSLVLNERNWNCVICNRGPIPEDPKVEQAQGRVNIRPLHFPDGADTLATAWNIFRELDPDVVIFGEEPFPTLEPFYEAARMLPAPFIKLEQYYEDSIGASRYGVDLMLLYGIRALWPEPPRDQPGFYKVVPPFIGEVTGEAELPVPKSFRGQPWVTVLGFDDRVFQGAIKLLRGLPGSPPHVVVLTHDPSAAAAAMPADVVPPDRLLALPIQADAVLFGLIAAGRVTVSANGFMQMMESLALGSPVIAVDRGIGMWMWALHDALKPYVCMEVEASAQLAAWLAECPFSPDQLAALARERDGAAICAGHVEAVVQGPSLFRKLQRLWSLIVWKTRGGHRAAPVEETS